MGNSEHPFDAKYSLYIVTALKKLSIWCALKLKILCRFRDDAQRPVTCTCTGALY